jgi:hypothetical protein
MRSKNPRPSQGRRQSSVVPPRFRCQWHPSLLRGNGRTRGYLHVSVARHFTGEFGAFQPCTKRLISGMRVLLPVMAFDLVSSIPYSVARLKSGQGRGCRQTLTDRVLLWFIRWCRAATAAGLKPLATNNAPFGACRGGKPDSSGVVRSPAALAPGG